jgi:hypothetical protein
VGLGVHRVLSAALVVLLSACQDHLTAPEAEAILTAIDEPLSNWEKRELLWQRLGWDRGLRLLNTVSQIRGRRDGRTLTYSAVVFERLMIPSTGSGRSPCLGPRWSLFLWREGASPEGMILTGGRFDRTLSPGGMCEPVLFPDPAPLAAWFPIEASGMQPSWLSRSGRGEISPGVDAGPCGFLPPGEAAALYRTMGVTCRVTRHRVRLVATLHATHGGG